MATISSPGIGSGMDIAGIVSKLSELERQPLVQLKKQAGSLQSRLSVYGQVKSQMASLQDAAAKLSSSAAWSQTKVNSANNAAVTATATGNAMPMKLDLEVVKLAKGQVSSFATVAVDQTLSNGSLEIQQGSWASGVFSPNGGVPTIINIEDGQNTVSQIAAKINSSGSNVQAYVVQDATGERLVLRSMNTGKDQGFNVKLNSAITSPDPAIAAPTSAPLSFISPAGDQFAQDAQFKLDGIEFTSATNTVAQALPGLSLQLQQVSTAPVQISVEYDQESVKKNIQAFLDSYNTLNSTLSNAMKYSSETKTSAALQGDSTAVGVQGALRSLFRTEISGWKYQRVSDIGITLQSDGSMGLDAKKLESAMTNTSDLKALFAGSTGLESLGLAKNVETFIKSALNTEGRVAVRTDALQSAISRNLQDQQRVNDRADRAQARLTKVYNSMDSKVGSLNALNSYVSQQLAAMSK
jgi:flagellar hook-associated protein 2